MNRQYPFDTPFDAALEPVVPTAHATGAARNEPPPFLCWLDRYFLATPRNRMQDDYIAYWH